MEKNALAVPVAIIVSAVIIAGAIFFVNRGPATDKPIDQGGTFTLPAPITEDEHLLGSPNADVVYLEFSDFECPFCKLFHDTMNDLIREFGASGRVAWAYRHFPLPIVSHENAPKIAEGSECAAELGGNAAFWEYTNAIFEQDVANVATPMNVPHEIAEDIGLDATAFSQCFESDKYAQKIERDFNDARNAGGNGTPYTIALLENPLTDGQRSDIQLLANQTRVPLELILFSENNMAIAFSGNLPPEFMRGATQILLGLPVGEEPLETETASSTTEETTE